MNGSVHGGYTSGQVPTRQETLCHVLESARGFIIGKADMSWAVRVQEVSPSSAIKESRRFVKTDWRGQVKNRDRALFLQEDRLRLVPHRMHLPPTTQRLIVAGFLGMSQ